MAKTQTQTAAKYDGVPNLDAMTQDELWQFWQDGGMSGGPSHTFARQIFPDRPKNYVNTAGDLKHYACNKAVAMKLRLEGAIDRALAYEQICDAIYDRLPEWARW